MKTLGADNMLFNPVEIGSIRLRNRIVMAPMTRHRSDLRGIPTPLNVEYYRQRAGAGLIITEGTYPSEMGRGYLFTPGICDREQIAGWKRVTDAVHAEGGRIVCQLMHCGRLSDPLLLPDCADPVAPSAVQPAADGLYTLNCPRPNRPYGRPRALSTRDVYGVIEEFRRATENAAEAGFDGVEIHGGNGYLPMQFFSTNANLRQDEFGGSVENRCRFVLLCVDAMSSVQGATYVGVKIAPGQTFADVRDDDAIATCNHVVGELSRRGIGYLQVSRRNVGWDVLETVRRLFDGPLIGVGGFSRASAAESIASGAVDAVAFGQAFLANPDLVERYRNGWTVNRPDSAGYYAQGSAGYSDYPCFGQHDVENQIDADSPFASVLLSERQGSPGKVDRDRG